MTKSGLHTGLLGGMAKSECLNTFPAMPYASSAISARNIKQVVISIVRTLFAVQVLLGKRI